MKITKFGHSSLLIEENGARILTDPGTFAVIPELMNLDAVLITHTHGDHFDIPTLKRLLADNPSLQLITHEGVGEKLSEEGIPFTLCKDGETLMVKGVEILGDGTTHACVHEKIPLIGNRGFLIGGRLYHPGDSLHTPKFPVELLALPVGGPWLKLSECIDFAIALRPKIVFPIHDGMLRPENSGYVAFNSKIVLNPEGIEFIPMGEGSVHEF